MSGGMELDACELIMPQLLQDTAFSRQEGALMTRGFSLAGRNEKNAIWCYSVLNAMASSPFGPFGHRAHDI
jgi:hypothetical protein